MSQTDVDTLDKEVQNTETDLDQTNEVQNTDEHNTDPDNGHTDDETSVNEPDGEDDGIMSRLSDDEFTEYLNSGKLPDGIEPKPKGEKENDNEQHSDGKSSNAQDSPDSGDSGLQHIRSEQSNGKNGRSNNAGKQTGEGKDLRSKTDASSTRQDQASNGNNSVNYKEVYDTIFKPFKANGKMITPRTVEDIVSLMQMGSNYTQKMQNLQPIRKVAESVSKAGISEEDLSFLIDLHKGDKEAIKKLMKKHEVDPLDLNLDETNYVPKNNLASDEDVEYSGILQDIQSSLPKIQEIMNKTWDAKSKQMLLSDPKLMIALHEEIEMGRFDEAQSRLEIEKTFGRYKGKSDVEAYVDVVNKLAEEQRKAAGTTNNAQNNQTTNKKSPNKNIPDKSKAAPTATKPGNKNSSTITPKDLFSMSEDEFNKLSIRDLV